MPPREIDEASGKGGDIPEEAELLFMEAMAGGFGGLEYPQALKDLLWGRDGAGAEREDEKGDPFASFMKI